MTSPQKSPTKESNPRAISGLLDPIKADFNTVRIILITACVVLVLISIPLFFLLRNFVTFETLDNYLKVTESVRPKILHTISEELYTGYSKNFIFRSSAGNAATDNTMLFYAVRDQKVKLSVDAIPVEGAFQPVMIQLNSCTIGPERTGSLHMYDYDLTKEIERCVPDEPNLHTLRIVLPNGLKKATTLQIKCVVVVYQRIHEHLEGAK